ncbi:MAG: ricin-type beta-trefoil lectin domain protein [Deltaproteobacteria bacterium]|nr:ricin-type beta-trefoil lectin domain protein [Deltaproteobacteria bacterium]
MEQLIRNGLLEGRLEPTRLLFDLAVIVSVASCGGGAGETNSALDPSCLSPPSPERESEVAAEGAPETALAIDLTIDLTDGVPQAPRGRADDRELNTSPLDEVGVLSKRDELVSFIWGAGGLPQRLPPEVLTLDESPVGNLENLASVEALRITMESEQETLAYLFRPRDGNNRAVIVHHGHACVLDDGPGSGTQDLGIQRTIRALLADGYSVVGMNMPWIRPGNSELGVDADCRFNHSAVLDLPTTSGSPLKFFLEPISIVINHLTAGGYSDVNMIGLSGGGWTTTLYAAVDPRVKMSFPVAGTLPLYLRVEPYSNDEEQFLPELYGAYGGEEGIAGYLDLYLLGASGAGRKQVQILNRQDDCCFGERQHDALALEISFEDAVRGYESSVRSALATAGAGAFQAVIDEASPSHMISPSAIESYILPALSRYQISTTIRNVWGHRCVDAPYSGECPEDPTNLQLYDCNGGINQQFEFREDGSVHSRWGDLCWSADPEREPLPGDRLQLRRCDGRPNQEFDVPRDGTVRHRLTGLCVEVQFSDRAPWNGDRVRLATCHARVNQRFSINL